MMGKMLHCSGGISLTAFRECSYQRPHLASQVWGLSSSLGELASSNGPYLKDTRDQQSGPWQLPHCVWAAVTPGGENACLSSKSSCVLT